MFQFICNSVPILSELNVCSPTSSLTKFGSEIFSSVALEDKIERLNIKLNFLIVLMLIALTFMNPVVAEIVKDWLGK
jgi:hypothetical protein